MFSAPPSIVLLAFPNMQLLDVTGPLQVFASANELVAQRGLDELYSPRVVAAEAGPVTSSSGLAVLAGSLRSVKAPVDTLIVPGGWGIRQASADQRLIRSVDR
ncbi:transcriptional regulator GlxA family with amidase domain [Paraburkholderia sp. WSM4177]|nr:transcriptional regulator GlxA family with amidase domain [Paraburkholderia sp. WSM4177]